MRRQEEEAVKGQKKRGRKPRVVEPTPPGEAKANVTDPDSRVMKTRQGYVQGYNVQAVVSEDQIILAVGVTQEANDVQQLLPMLERMNQNLAAAEGSARTGLSPRTYPQGPGSAGAYGAQAALTKRGRALYKSEGCWWSRCLAR